jgi:hypothetical protein
VNLAGNYPKVMLTEDGTVFTSFHSPSHVLSHRVGRWTDQSSVGYLSKFLSFLILISVVSWKPLNETHQHGSGQKGAISVHPNANPLHSDVAPYLVAMAYQGTATESRKLFYKIGYYAPEQ